jgi:hypothetical protein
MNGGEQLEGRQRRGTGDRYSRGNASCKEHTQSGIAVEMMRMLVTVPLALVNTKPTNPTNPTNPVHS